ncbi:anthranilate synthase component II [Sphingobacterium hungaricum]
MHNKKVLVIDNYDSFTYNLVHLLQELNADYEVWRNDKFELEDVDAYHKILLSPGPGIPEEAGLLMPLIKRYSDTKSILGICLGQQAIAEVFGGSLFNMEKPLHGVATDIVITDNSEKLFQNFPKESKIGRYHSWAVEKSTLPETLKITALDADGTIMALSHKTLDVKGMQFHPESILTENGKILIENWLKTP